MTKEEIAITAYTKGMVSIGEAAEMAKMPYLAFFEELRRRRIVVLDESINLSISTVSLTFGVSSVETTGLFFKFVVGFSPEWRIP